MRIKNTKRVIKAVINLLLCEPSSIKFAHLWVRSLLPGYNPLNGEVPWLTFKAKAWLESYLKPNMSVFEYGSGGSTIFLSKKVSKLISIEHDKNWYTEVSRALSKKKTRIVNISYVNQKRKFPERCFLMIAKLMHPH